MIYDIQGTLGYQEHYGHVAAVSELVGDTSDILECWPDAAFVFWGPPSGPPLALRTTSSLLQVEGLGHTLLVENYAGSLDEEEAAAFAASLTVALKCTVVAFPSSASRDAFLAGGYAVAPADVTERVVAALRGDRDYGGGDLVMKCA